MMNCGYRPRITGFLCVPRVPPRQGFSVSALVDNRPDVHAVVRRDPLGRQLAVPVIVREALHAAPARVAETAAARRPDGEPLPALDAAAVLAGKLLRIVRSPHEGKIGEVRVLAAVEAARREIRA